MVSHFEHSSLVLTSRIVGEASRPPRHVQSFLACVPSPGKGRMCSPCPDPDRSASEHAASNSGGPIKRNRYGYLSLSYLSFRLTHFASLIPPHSHSLYHSLVSLSFYHGRNPNEEQDHPPSSTRYERSGQDQGRRTIHKVSNQENDEGRHNPCARGTFGRA